VLVAAPAPAAPTDAPPASAPAGAPAASVPAEAPAASTPAEAPPHAPRPFAPGEETVLHVHFLGLPAGEARIQIGEPAGSVWPIILLVKTDGVAGIVDIREHIVSLWDESTALTLGFDLRAYEVGDYHVERVRLDRANRKGTYERVRKGERVTQTFDIAENTQDLMSAVMWLRLQKLQPGERYEVPVCSGTRQFMLVAEVVAREMVETPGTKYATVKVQVQTVQAGKLSTKRESFLWFSDDARHILVRTTADFAFGHLEATLKSYRPGNRVASRP
jgi:hypothetical protein